MAREYIPLFPSGRVYPGERVKVLHPKTRRWMGGHLIRPSEYSGVAAGWYQLDNSEIVAVSRYHVKKV
jgi:hypothetical protein